MLRHPIVACFSGACLIGSTAVAQLAPGMDGRANDANNQIGSGGRNAPVSQTYFNTANLYISGNVTGGRAFQGFSPIRDTSSLFLSLPTAGIGRFQRDTVVITQVLDHRTPSAALPFFDPTQTVTGIRGIQRGLNAPGSSTPRSTTTIPQGTMQAPYGVNPTGLTYGLRYNQPVVPNSSIYNRQNMPLINQLFESNVSADIDALRSGPVYGRTVVNTRALTPLSRAPGTLPDPYGLGTEAYRPADPLTRHTRLLGDDKKPSSEQMIARSRDLLSPTSLSPKLFAPAAQEPIRDTLTGRTLPAPPRYAAAADTVAVDPASGLLAPVPLPVQRDRVAQTAPNIADRGTGGTLPVPGYAPSPDTMQAESMPTAAPESPDVLGLRERYAGAIATGPTVDPDTAEKQHSVRVTELMRKAEAHVAAGDFYKAINLYELAASFEPDNAYVRFGYGHALLAAGEYLTAVRQISAGLRLLPDLNGFRPDFASFTANPESLDIRRADLERRLAQKEDYRLRFLLGYTEYFSGLEKFGLPDLKKAAARAPAGSIIARFPDLLSAKPKQPATDSP